MPVHQAYSKLYYDHFKPEIDKAWLSERKRLRKTDFCKLKGEKLEEALDNRHISFTNGEMKRRYEDESDEVKANVERYRKENISYMDVSGDEKIAK